MIRPRATWIVLLFVFLVCGSSAVFGSVISVNVNPANVTATVNDRSTFSVTWRATRNANPQFPDTISSQGGVFLGPGGSTLFSVSSLLQRTSVQPNTPIQFPETVVVPRSLAVEARRRGFSFIRYRRQFEDSLGGQSAEVRINLTSSGGADFAIQRVALRFANRSLIRRAPVGEEIGAFADLRFTGTGHLEAQWEVAGPTGTQGEPLFRPIRLIRRYLGGNRTVTLEAPDLPTQAAGVYLLRLTITDPEPAFDEPVLRYAVFDPGVRADRPPVKIRLIDPPAGSTQTPSTRFRWQPISQANVYQWELYESRGQATLPETTESRIPHLPLFLPEEAREWRPVLGTVTDGDTRSVSLTPPQVNNIKWGTFYLWRVRAIDDQGNEIAVSPARMIQFRPPEE